MKYFIRVFMIGLCFPMPVFAQVLTLNEALELALKRHPSVQAENYRHTALEQEVRRARANYYPRLNAMALITKGFPGSAGATGIGGLMVSPYHKGPSAGLLLEQEIYDFGRTSGAVNVAKKESESAGADENLVKIDVGSRVTRIYFECVTDRSLTALYKRLFSEAKHIEDEVAHFVASGQRSIVERYLSQSQTEEALTEHATYEKRWEKDRENLAMLTGVSGDDGCPTADALASENVLPANEVRESPLVTKASRELAVSEARLGRVRSDYLPRLVGVASIGYMDRTELGIEKNYYAAAVGLIFPLFEGFRTDAEAARSRAQILQREKEVEAAKLSVSEANVSFDREIDAETIELEHLVRETELAESAFTTARKRYFHQQGSLVDLREALRNYARSWSELYTIKVRRAEKTAQKAMLNGALAKGVAPG